MRVLVAQSCLTLCDPMGCSRPGSSVHGILQERILELLFPSPGDLLDPGIKPGLLHCRLMMINLQVFITTFKVLNRYIKTELFNMMEIELFLFNLGNPNMLIP